MNTSVFFCVGRSLPLKKHWQKAHTLSVRFLLDGTNDGPISLPIVFGPIHLLLFFSFSYYIITMIPRWSFKSFFFFFFCLHFHTNSNLFWIIAYLIDFSYNSFTRTHANHPWRLSYCYLFKNGSFPMEMCRPFFFFYFFFFFFISFCLAIIMYTYSLFIYLDEIFCKLTVHWTLYLWLAPKSLDLNGKMNLFVLRLSFIPITRFRSLSHHQTLFWPYFAILRFRFCSVFFPYLFMFGVA